MIQAIGLLLFRNRGQWGRLAGMAAGICVGVLLALLLIAGSQALETRDVRAAWLSPATTEPDGASSEQTLVAASRDAFDGKRISRLDVSAPRSGDTPPLGVPIPEPGAYLASPALAALVQGDSTGSLAERYGEFQGEIPATMLGSPDSLAVLVGTDRERLAAMSSAGAVTSFDGAAFGGNQNYQTLAFVGALALLIPAILLVSVSTQLGAAARAERNRTLRTIGASPRFLAAAAVVETGVTALLGALLGTALFFAARPLFGALPVAGERLVPSDLTVSPQVIGAVALTAVIGSVLAAWWSARQARSAPAGARHGFESRPSPFLAVPLLLGIVAFALIRFFGSSLPIPLPILVIAAFTALSLGLLIAGPYFAWLAGRAFTALARSGDAVLASRRILRTPRAAFRSVAGLVAATFLVTVFAAAASAHVDADSYSRDALMRPDSVGAYLPGASAAGATESSRVTHRIATQLGKIPGVRDVVFTRAGSESSLIEAGDARILNPELAVSGDVMEIVGGIYSLSDAGEPLVPSGLRDLSEAPIESVIVRTDGSSAAIEATRTALLRLPEADVSMGAWTRPEYTDGRDSDLATQFTEIGRLAIAIVTLIAAIVLVTSTVSALYDRRRTIALLRLLGMPEATLPRMIAWETIVPLIGITVPTVALGYATGWLLITSLSDERVLGWPDPLLGVALAATALMAVAAIVVPARLARRLTRPETLRFE